MRWYYAVKYRAFRRERRADDGRRGLIALQIDALAYADLKRAIDAGWCPTIARLATPTFVERDIDDDPAWQRAYFATIPVVELGEGRLETVISAAKLRRLLAEQLDGIPA